MPGTDGRRRRRRRGASASPREIGFPVMVKAAAGGGGKGMRIVADASELARAVRAGAGRGRGGVRQRRRLRREVHRARRATSRSRSSATARQRRPPRRARLLDPAAPPEADRGGAVAGARRRSCARADGRGRRARPRAPSATTAPAPSSSCSTQDGGVLLHGDEHPHPGRAPGHRDGHRRRPRQASRSASPPASRCRVTQDDVELPRPRHRVPHQRRGPGARLRAVARARSTDCHPPGGPGVRVDSHVYAGLHGAAALRLAAGEADRLGRDREEAMPQDGAGAARDCASTESHDGHRSTSCCSSTRASAPGGSTPATCTTCWATDTT